MVRRATQEEFLEKCRHVHGNTYDYSKAVYLGNKQKVCIICPLHSEFYQRPNDHISSKQGCPQCGIRKYADKNINTTEYFLQRAYRIHGDIYDYSQSDYKGCKTPITIICRVHGPFRQTPNNHLDSASGCPTCGIENVTWTKNQFIEAATKVHGDTYDYSLVKYKTSRIKVDVVCKIHGSYTVKPTAHIHSRTGCPFCMNKTEGKVYNWLRETYPHLEIIRQYRFKNNKKRSYDIAFPSLKLLLEIDGDQHFIQVREWNSPEENQVNDTVKALNALLHTWSVMRMLQDDIWYDKIDWKSEIERQIEAAQSIPQPSPSCIFIGGDIYDKHRDMYQVYSTLISGENTQFKRIIKALSLDLRIERRFNRNERTERSIEILLEGYQSNEQDVYSRLSMYLNDQLHIFNRIEYQDDVVTYKFNPNLSIYHQILLCDQ